MINPPPLPVQEPRPKHVLVFQHIPLYLKSPDEDDNYFNLQREVRQSLLERFKKAGETAALISPSPPHADRLAAAQGPVQHFAQGHFDVADGVPGSSNRFARSLQIGVRHVSLQPSRGRPSGSESRAASGIKYRPCFPS